MSEYTKIVLELKIFFSVSRFIKIAMDGSDM